MSNSIEPNIDPEISSIEYNKLPFYDACVQLVLPHMLERDSRFGINIGLFFTETEGWTNVWPQKISLMDKVIVPSHIDKLRIVRSMEKTKYKIPQLYEAPIPTDVDKFAKEYPKFQGIEEDYFNFYYIGDIIERKNVEKMVAAYHIAFSSAQKVNLVIKTSPQYKDRLLGIINQVKDKLRIRYNPLSYKKEILIFDRLSEDEICSLHSSCHAFIMPSSGESWSLVCADAAGFGNYVLSTKEMGINEHLWPVTGNLTIDTVKERVFTTDFPIADLYTSNEKWGIPTIDGIVEKMRSVYYGVDSGDIPEKSEDNVKRIKDKFSYQAIANKLKEII